MSVRRVLEYAELMVGMVVLDVSYDHNNWEEPDPRGWGSAIRIVKELRCENTHEVVVLGNFMDNDDVSLCTQDANAREFAVYADRDRSLGFLINLQDCCPADLPPYCATGGSDPSGDQHGVVGMRAWRFDQGVYGPEEGETIRQFKDPLLAIAESERTNLMVSDTFIEE